VPYRWFDIALERLRAVEPGEVMQALANPHRLPLEANAEMRLMAIIARTRIAGRWSSWCASASTSPSGSWRPTTPARMSSRAS
jgi:hypothetical protein